ncbi:glucose PTS transporter subunit IIA [Liquorilactobacillus oeni]|nr:glucose PTS transporter subunit IIA [Liquorilactobacillus oeni]
MASNKFDAAKIAEEIYKNAGGLENVLTFNNCMTRVRLNIKDDSLVDTAALKKIPGVLGVVHDEELQVVIGPGKVNKVAAEMAKMSGTKLGEQLPDNAGFSGKKAVAEKAARIKEQTKAKQKPSKFKTILKDISNIFVPMIPAFVGSGLIAGIAAILSNLLTSKTISGTEWTQIVLVLNVIKNGMFTYLVIYTGINAARVWGATPTLGGVTGAVTLLTGMTPDAPIKNLFTGQALVAGQGGIIGVIFAVWMLSVLEKKLHKIIPDSIDIIITPMIALLVLGLAEIFLIMPLAGFVSDGLVGSLKWVLNVGGAFSGFVLGAAFLPMVMLGLHQILTPIHVQMIQQLGYTPLLPILAMAGGGQVGAAFALWVRLRRDKEMTEMIKGALPVGILGIGEPLIYGVTLPLGRPFITACLGGGIGGAVIGWIGHVGAIAIGPSGLPLIPLIANGYWWAYVLGLLAAYLGGFIITYFWGIPKDRLAQQKQLADEFKDAAIEPQVKENVKETLTALTDGKIQGVEYASDKAFASKKLGDGYVIVPASNKIYAPVSGTVSSIFPTKHALGITSDDGFEILIHLGIDTVSLKGTPFDIRVREGQHVSAGILVAVVDWSAVEQMNKSTETMVVVTNMDAVKRLILKVSSNQSVNAKDEVAEVITR